MRVVHVQRIGGIGGSERHALTLLPALAARGVDVAFVGLDDTAAAPDPFYAELDAPFVRLPCPRDLDPRLARDVTRAVHRFRPDVVHTHLVHADVYGAVAAALTGTKLVSTKHNDDRFRVGPFRYAERALAARASRVIAITDALRRFNVERVGLSARKVVTVHYGLDRPPAPWAANPELGLPDGARVLLGIARLERQKGVDVALAALPSIRRREPRAVLVVLGEGPERRGLEAQARALGVSEAVFLPGRVGDVTALLLRSELLVHPARWEGFGLGPLEAMLASTPVVASAVSSLPELVVDGETGFLVPPDEPEELARAVGRLLDDRALVARLGEAGRRRAREEFSVERMAERTIDVYRATTAGR
jgi:glycosyltransferase involved in cell wall biosynthesis